MKIFFSILIALLISVNLFCQTGFSYQGVLRNDTTGKLRTNETLELTANLVQDDKIVYTERHHVVTNSYGVFSIVIGKGNSQAEFSDTLFLNKDFSSLKTTYLVVKEGLKVRSNTQILGVPFAEVAKVALKAHIDFPAGTIVAFGGDITKIPNGWLLCDGQGYDKTTYSELFNAVGTNWGTDGNLFRVPDLRGVFLRGVNDINSDTIFIDPEAGSRIRKYDNGNTGNNVGSYQNHKLESHNHKILHMQAVPKAGDSNPAWGAHSSYSSNNTEYTGGKETRPVNAYVNYIIKY